VVDGFLLATVVAAAFATLLVVVWDLDVGDTLHAQPVAHPHPSLSHPAALPHIRSEMSAMIDEMINPVQRAELDLTSQSDTSEYLSANQAVTKETNTTNIQEMVL